MRGLITYTALLLASLSFGQTIINNYTGGVYLTVDDSSYSSNFLDSTTISYIEFIGEGFNGDTIETSFEIYNTIDDDFIVPDLNVALGNDQLIFNISLDTLALNEKAIGTILFVPNTPADSIFTLIQEIVEFPFGDIQNTDVSKVDTITYTYYSMDATIMGIAKGDQFQNINCQSEDTATAVLSDSCGVYVEDIATSIALEIENDSMFAAANVMVSQSIASGFLLSVDSVLTLTYSYDIVATGHSLSGQCNSYLIFVDDIAEGYTCPVDSILPIIYTNGNGGTATIEGSFGLQLISKPDAQKTTENGPLQNIIVYLLDPVSGNVVGEDTTDIEGDFKFTGLSDGSYVISLRYNGQQISGGDIITISGGTGGAYISAESDGTSIMISQGVLTAVTTDSTEVTLTIYPNPTTDHATISSSEIIKQVTVVSLKGETVMELTNEDNDVEITGLGNGTYILKIITETSSYSQRLVVK